MNTGGSHGGRTGNIQRDPSRFPALRGSSTGTRAARLRRKLTEKASGRSRFRTWGNCPPSLFLSISLPAYSLGTAEDQVQQLQANCVCRPPSRLVSRFSAGIWNRRSKAWRPAHHVHLVINHPRILYESLSSHYYFVRLPRRVLRVAHVNVVHII